MGLFKKKPKEKQEVSIEIQEEIKQSLNFTIHSGFYSKEEILSQARQIFVDICLSHNMNTPQDAYIKQLTERFITKAKSISKGKNNYNRLRKVFDQLNEERIIAIHFAGYTLDDGFEEVGSVFEFMKENDIPRRGYCFYHQQDILRSMDESIQCLYIAFHSMNDDKETALEVGKRIVELLKGALFDVEWSGSVNDRITIHNFLWDKEYDGEDYGADRAIRLMKNLITKDS